MGLKQWNSLGVFILAFQCIHTGSVVFLYIAYDELPSPQQLVMYFMKQNCTFVSIYKAKVILVVQNGMYLGLWCVVQ